MARSQALLTVRGITGEPQEHCSSLTLGQRNPLHLSSGLSPKPQAPGRLLRSGGSSFVRSHAVTLNGIPAQFKVAASGFLSFTVPAGAVSAPVAITNAGGSTTSTGILSRSVNKGDLSLKSSLGFGKLTNLLLLATLSLAGFQSLLAQAPPGVTFLHIFDGGQFGREPGNFGRPRTPDFSLAGVAFGGQQFATTGGVLYTASPTGKFTITASISRVRQTGRPR